MNKSSFNWFVLFVFITLFWIAIIAMISEPVLIIEALATSTPLP